MVKNKRLQSIRKQSFPHMLSGSQTYFDKNVFLMLIRLG